MKNRFRLFREGVLLAALPVALSAQAPPAATRPRLVVVVVVDQMRADYLTRFAGFFSGGLARLMREGMTFTNANHDHSGTETSPGHATIATGVFPSHSGIVANEWYERSEGRVVYSVEDSSAAILGHPRDPGRSPRRLLADAVGDWLKQASPQSHVVSVASKDRAAILMGGRRPDAAYWYNIDDGRYQTSSYYAKRYPAWVDSFNLARPAERHFKEGWPLLREPETYFASTEDSVPAEADGVHVTFPHAIASYAELLYTPFGDELTLDFARAAVTHEALGADSIPDLLWVSCSSGDYVGHRYGPLSMEIEDYYLRLDGYLGDFFAFLDQRVGAGRYTVVLTADHGGLPLPEQLARRGFPSRRLLSKEATAAFWTVESSLATELGIPRPIFGGYTEGFLLHTSAAAAKGITPAQLQRAAADKLRQLPFIADVYTADELSSSGGGSGRQYLEQYRHNFKAGRSPDLMIRYAPYVLFMGSDMEHGTSHGTPYPYDTHVPLVFLGAGIPASRRGEAVRTIDIAPTLAGTLGVRPTAEIDGHALPITLRGRD